MRFSTQVIRVTRHEANPPQVVEHYTTDIVYERLAPALLTPLKLRNSNNESGERDYKYHQSLAGDFGQPELHTHFVWVIAIMNTVTHNNPRRAWAEFG